MKFVFCDKSKTEMNVITNVLYEEKIPHKIRPYLVKDYFFSEDDDDDDFCIVEEMYNIEVYTDLEHFDFVKAIAYKKIKDRIQLEKCYIKKVSKKHVQRVHKKDITNTDNRNKGK